MAGVVQGKDIDECVDRGQWLAALSIKELGPSLVVSFLLKIPRNADVPQISIPQAGLHSAAPLNSSEAERISGSTRHSTFPAGPAGGLLSFFCIIIQHEACVTRDDP